MEFVWLALDREFTPAEIATETSSMLSECDGVIAHYEPESDQAPTACELLMAKRFDLPVVVWTDTYTSQLSNLSPWWHYVTTRFQQTGRDSLTAVNELL